MSCSGGCGSSSCRSCGDITVELPEGNGIESMEVTEGGDILVIYTDGTTDTLTIGLAIPEDNWVELDESTVASFSYTGSATLNSSSLDLAYKVTDAQTAIIQGVFTSNVTVTALANSLNFNCQIAPITSNWFAGTKRFTSVLGAGLVQNHVPVSIVTTTATSSIPNQIGKVYTGYVGLNTILALGSTNLQLPNGTYNMIVDFQITCKLA